MTSKEFIIWFKGYSDAIISTPTQAQWDNLKKVVLEVKDEPTPSFPTFTPNTTPMPLPYYPNPLDNPYKVTCTTGSAVAYGISTPYGYNPSSITYGYSSGSLWSYTDALDRYNNWHYTLTSPNQPTTGSNQLELEFEPK